MKLYDGLRIGFLEIRSHKLRAFLTLSGIAVGITSIVAMTGFLSGFQRDIRGGLERCGWGRLLIFGKETNDNTHRSPGLLYEDALAVREKFHDIRVVSPSVTRESVLFYGDFNAKVEVKGVTPDWAKLDWKYKVRGRFFNAADLRDTAQVCVLIRRLHEFKDKKGKDKSTDEEEWWRQDDPLAPLFKRYDPLSKTLRLGNTAFRVVGVLEERPREDGVNMGNNDATVLLPITSFQKRLSAENKQIESLDLDSGDQASSYVLARRVSSLLKRRHRGVEDYQVMNLVDFMGPIMSWVNMATFIMAAIAAIALFAGGVGIMNITLASVNARIKEIGIRKSVGARESDIHMQFLLEAAALSLSGGILGVLLGLGICFAVNAMTEMHILISPVPAAVALAVSIGIGVAFSWYPARRAARLDPVEALRQE